MAEWDLAEKVNKRLVIFAISAGLILLVVLGWLNLSQKITDSEFETKMAQAETDTPLACHVKTRSTGAPRGPVTFQNGVCTAPEGLAGVAPGQSAVFYDADGVILCGGVIQ